MSTITTKQLRENMAQVVRELQKGRTVRLSYRHKVIGVLRPIPAAPASLRRGSPRAMQNFLEAVDFGAVPAKLQNSSRSMKQEIAELRSRDLG